MFDIYLPILPSSYLSHSVITTVWIGILVIGFFNLRFGWVFSGLVVPGYLTPLLLIKPLSVAVIVFEGIVTYLIIYLISEVAGKRGWWTNFFGRDRFFALLMGSIGVRLFFDGFGLPWLSAYTLETYNINLDYQDSLHSFGLIIVALIANQLWKPKLFHGLIQLVITVGITYLIIRYFFVAYTNFSLSNIGYLYEDVAGSILASPKSYIILITTAFIASRMNLFYGWDFNGILVPSLLALQWYQPSKILTSFIEAYIILLLATLVLKLPIFQNITIEGARKMLLFFNIGFLYKIMLSFAIVYFYPEHKVSDYFGFGYLLSTLIAVKMYDKVNMALFTRTTLQTSIVSIIIATTVGYSLTLLPNSNYFYLDKRVPKEPSKIVHSEQPFLLYLEKQKINLYSHNQEYMMHSPEPAQLDTFKNILKLIDKDFYKHLQEIEKLLYHLHYKLTIVEDHYLILTQEVGYNGWGMYVIDLTSSSDLVIELPYPLETSNMLTSAAILMKYTQAKVMAISGVPLKLEDKILSSEFNNYYSLYHAFHKHYAKQGVIQVRRLGKHLYHKLLKTASHSSKDKPINSLLFIKGYMPKQFHLNHLHEQIKTLQVIWDKTTSFSLQKESMRNGFAELYLSKNDRIKLISSYPYLGNDGLQQESSIHSIDGLLQSWLLDKKIELAPKASEKYEKPTMQSLRFFDHVILTPLLGVLKSWEEKTFDEEHIKKELQSIALAAQSIGYSLTWYVDTRKQKKYIILHENSSTQKHYWGTYIFDFGKKENIMIQVPRPFYESHTFEYSLELFEQLNAKALLLSGAHPLANNDRSADVMLFNNKRNIFNLTSQVIFRESGFETMNALQIRGIGEGEEQSKKAILSLNNGINSLGDLNPTQKTIYDYLKAYTPLVLNDGNFYSAGYDTTAIQSHYLMQSINNTFNILWLPYSIRGQYRQRNKENITIGAFNALNIEVLTLPLTSIYMQYKNANIKIKQEIINSIKYYLDTKDIIELESLSKRSDLKIKVIIDSNNHQPYLILLTPLKHQLIGVVKLNAQPPYNIEYRETIETLEQVLERFYFSSSTFLEVQ
ncbi:MAG: poly-gamma-glutamate biosynthesis protein PgsC/CapC [Campylobacterota bacterium]|nr:poly-gamma-glutamate biosynthesis protein PgsC/CapC [Campylobacterota bacterium]